MSEVSVIGLDLAKHVFQVHGADEAGRVVIRKKLRRAQVLEFFGRQPRCVVALEACGVAHFWGREIRRLGHEVRLIPPAYFKLVVTHQKGGMADAEAICEAAQRPTMRFVAVKGEGRQAAAVIFRSRDLLVRQRTQLINVLRGHMGAFGLVVPQGAVRVKELIALVTGPGRLVPEAARSALQILVSVLTRLEAEIRGLEAEIVRRTWENETAVGR
jgi:transposase